MLSSEQVHDAEERLRKNVRALPDDKRLVFFKKAEQRLKDPDTYAALNYLFIAGLHHFYLGKWARGLLNISVFLTGVVMLFTPLTIIGILLIIAITIIELYALFKAQTIVQDHNNRILEKIYRELIRKNRDLDLKKRDANL
jgi:TM2 domain-containing membrane protein YozV